MYLLHLIHLSQNLLLGLHNGIQFLLRDLEGSKTKQLSTHGSCEHSTVLSLAGVLCWKVYLSRLPWGPCSSPGDLLCQGRDVSPLFIKDHIQLPVKLFDFQMDTILSLKDLSELAISHALEYVIRWKAGAN